MMTGSIRFRSDRLVRWASLALILCLFAATAWLAMRPVSSRLLTKDLRARITDVKEFIQRKLR